MRRSRMTTIATIAAGVSFGSTAAAANPHPNIVFIISEDQGCKAPASRPHIRTLSQGGARLEVRRFSYGTGHGFAFQISAAYWTMVRSLENFPELAIFKIALRAHSSRSV